MVVSAMAMQNQASSPHSNTLTEVANGIALDAGGQPTAGEAHVPKIRKPYTITKQRERWTEEEHKKFLEALKLYGRAWRKIEEHVGSKTAVQIRSHAQKFFSKVTRESNDTASSIKPIEIPPPRPKRKPMHPYPRKLVLPTKKETPVDEQPARSTSPKSSISDQEKSPVSVLSAMASDTLGSADSNTPNGSQSPVSSANVTNNITCLRAEDYAPQEEDMSESTRDEMVSVKLELFPKVDCLVKEGSVEETSARSVKLFGKTVVVTDAQGPSSSMRTSTPPLDMGGGLVQAREQNPILANITLGNTENSQSRLPWGVLPPVYYMSTNSDPAECGSTAPLPWWGFYRGVPFPFVSLNTFGSAKESAGCNFEEVQGKENYKEGSWTGSNTESDGNGGKNWDHETQSHLCGPERRQQQPDEKLASSRKRAGPEKCVKGFVPYKRCLASRESQSSATTCDQSEAQRTRLCL